MTEPAKLSEIKMSGLMPKLDPDAVKALQANMQALGRMAEQANEAMRQAAPGIMANIAKALPTIPAHREERQP
jgi:hypothetical protein